MGNITLKHNRVSRKDDVETYIQQVINTVTDSVILNFTLEDGVTLKPADFTIEIDYSAYVYLRIGTTEKIRLGSFRTEEDQSWKFCPSDEFKDKIPEFNYGKKDLTATEWSWAKHNIDTLFAIRQEH